MATYIIGTYIKTSGLNKEGVGVGFGGSGVRVNGTFNVFQRAGTHIIFLF